jgi:hypothetical protein
MTNPPISPLVADLISASLAITHDTTNRLIESLQSTIADAVAHRRAVEAGVSALLGGDHMPNPAAIERAVFTPDPRLVAHYRQEAAG